MKLLLAFMTFVASVSLACSATRFAGTLTPAPGNATATPSAAAQEKSPCTLDLSQSPSIYGLRLGMSPDEVLSFFPGSETDPELKSQLAAPPSKFGTSNFSITPSKYESRDKFAGVSQITFTLLDGRVSRLNVGYAGPEYAHVDQFVGEFVEGTNLPAADQWNPHPGLDKQLKTVKCADFEARVFAGGPGGSLNYVLLHDLQADEKLQERRRKAKPKVSPTPGP